MENKMNSKLVFCGLGQYNILIQGIFKTLCIFNQFLIGGWFDIQEGIFIREKSVICRLNKFNHFLIKSLLRKEKEFLISTGYTFVQSSEENNKDGFTHFQNSNTFIIPENLSFVKYNEF